MSWHFFIHQYLPLFSFHSLSNPFIIQSIRYRPPNVIFQKGEHEEQDVKPPGDVPVFQPQGGWHLQWRDLRNAFPPKVYGSDDPEVSRGKPHPDIFTVAASRFGLTHLAHLNHLTHLAHLTHLILFPPGFTAHMLRFDPPPASPENCLVIEDSMAGVEAGLLAGMQVIFTCYHLTESVQVVMVVDVGPSHPGATAVLHSLEEFRPEEWGLPPLPRGKSLQRGENTNLCDGNNCLQVTN